MNNYFDHEVIASISPITRLATIQVDYKWGLDVVAFTTLFLFFRFIAK